MLLRGGCKELVCWWVLAPVVPMGRCWLLLRTSRNDLRLEPAADFYGPNGTHTAAVAVFGALRATGHSRVPGLIMCGAPKKGYLATRTPPPGGRRGREGPGARPGPGAVLLQAQPKPPKTTSLNVKSNPYSPHATASATPPPPLLAAGTVAARILCDIAQVAPIRRPAWLCMNPGAASAVCTRRTAPVGNIGCAGRQQVSAIKAARGSP